MSDVLTRSGRLKSFAVVSAVALGLSAGAYGIASAASGSGSATGTATAAATVQPAAATPQATDPQQPWGGQRSDETPLTGDTATKVKAAALAKLPGASVVRVETDAEGNAAYEAHVVTADGSPATVYVGEDFSVTSVEQR
jgi:hypothetical protein